MSLSKIYTVEQNLYDGRCFACNKIFKIGDEYTILIGCGTVGNGGCEFLHLHCPQINREIFYITKKVIEELL